MLKMPLSGMDGVSLFFLSFAAKKITLSLRTYIIKYIENQGILFKNAKYGVHLKTNERIKVSKKLRFKLRYNCYTKIYFR